MLLSTREVSQAQDQLAAAIVGLDDDDVRADSRLPGWTRAHVLTHLARNAEGLANLARWALTGDVVAMYAPGRRDADIGQGATRPAAEVVEDVLVTNDTLLRRLGELEGAVATEPLLAERVVRLGEDPHGGPAVHARQLPQMRLQEVVVHHHDLDLGLRLRDWHPAWIAAGLPSVWATVAGRLDDPPTLVVRTDGEPTTLAPAGGGVTVTGSARDLLAWLLGRSDPRHRARLSITPAGGVLPDLPPY